MRNLILSAFALSATLSTNAFAHTTPIKLNFLDEYVIPAELSVDGDKVGGLSSIEFVNGKYFMIADDYENPRYFQAKITIEGTEIENTKISNITFEKSLPLMGQKSSKRVVDPESLIPAPKQNSIVWTSEGSVKYNKPPAIFMQSLAGNIDQTQTTFALPSMFNIGKNTGPRHNAVFEGVTLDMSGKGIWVSMEGALKQDGEEATLKHGSMVRISHFDFASKQMQKQFAYYVEPLVDRKGAKPDAFRTTGLVEILQISEHHFLTMERSYTSGLKDGGNNVSIYLIDTQDATDTSNIASLKNQSFKAAKKTLVLDLATITDKLGSKQIDNLEGLTFGPTLANGNRSLLMVADNNFNVHGPQLNQVLLFEVSGM